LNARATLRDFGWPCFAVVKRFARAGTTTPCRTRFLRNGQRAPSDEIAFIRCLAMNRRE